MRLRLVTIDDADAIRAIYNEEVTGGTTTFDLVPRSADTQRAWVERHLGAHPAIVAVAPTLEEAVVGFGVLSPYRDRPAYATTVEDSVYVRRDHRGQGIGRLIVEELLRLAAGYGFHTVIARVVGENRASIALHHACGFEIVGTEREIGRKHGHWLDVVELQHML